MLTDNQNKIIEDIKNEFSKMNTQPIANAGGLINRALLDREIDASNKRRAELVLITEATNRSVRDKIDNDIYRLSQELIDSGIIVKRNPNNEWYVEIRCEHSNDKIYFAYALKNTYESFPDGTGLTYYTGFHSITFQGRRYDSIEEVCNSNQFMSEIKYLYRESKNKKQCK